MRKLLIGLRTSVKLMILFVVSCIVILAITMSVYRPIYSVYFDGEMVGYTQNKSKLQGRIADFIENGDDDNIAFVQIDKMPEYKLCFVKRDIETNDDEIYEKVTSEGQDYYKYYALTLNSEEKVYVASFEEAEDIVNELKEKNSNNVENLAIEQKYVNEKKETTDKETAVTSLYQEKPKVETPKKSAGTVKSASVGSGFKDVGIKFIKPITATITSRFGSRWGTKHKGTDFGAPTGTSIKAAAAGTVTYAGWNSGGYGYLVIISHGKGVQTYYAHCSSILTKVGATVKAGDLIAKSGATGHVTGPHLHFEVRINDVAYNPEYYL